MSMLRSTTPIPIPIQLLQLTRIHRNLHFIYPKHLTTPHLLQTSFKINPSHNKSNKPLGKQKQFLNKKIPGIILVKSPPVAPPLRISISGEIPPQRRPSSPSPSTSRIKKPTKPSQEKTQLDESALSNPDLGPFLLKLARGTIASGDGPNKALDYALRATSSFEKSVENGEVGLDLVMSLHVVEAIHCSLGRFEEAVEVLERAIKVLEHGDGGCV